MAVKASVLNPHDSCKVKSQGCGTEVVSKGPDEKTPLGQTVWFLDATLEMVKKRQKHPMLSDVELFYLQK
eukprot:126952-Amphidinium_carterae.1